MKRAGFILFLIFILTLNSEILRSEIKDYKNKQIKVGMNDFVFIDKKGNAGKPIKVFYYIPRGSNRYTPIVFFMHGTTRDARYHQKRFTKYAIKYRFILVAPRFSKRFYSTMYYHGGNVLTRRGVKVDREKWTYSAIENLFDYFKKQTGNRSHKYYILGHSAGGQFVHRMVLFMPSARIRKAVASNAGYYTFPLFSKRYFYGLKKTHVTKASLRKSLAVKLTILLGDKDNDPNHRYLPKSAGANAQGAHRFARGKYFFNTARNVAMKMKTRFNWDKQVVPGVGHSSSGTYRAVLPRLFKDRERKILYNDRRMQTGHGRILYNDPVTGRTIPVWYYKPAGTSPSSNVFILMHGSGRDGRRIRDRHIELAVKYKFILLAPEFSVKHFKGRAFYDGNVFEKYRGKWNPREKWTFKILDRVFEAIVKRSNLKAKGYYIYGNTGSGYFPMRMALFYPQSKALGVIVSNLYKYPVPDFDVRYPYGLKRSGITKEHLKMMYKKRIFLMAGVEGRNHILKNRFADKHGNNLYMRTKIYYQISKKSAKELGCKFNWKFISVPDTKWSYYRILKHALNVLGFRKEGTD